MRMFSIALLGGGIAAVVVSLFSLVFETAAVRELHNRERTIEMYSRAASECQRKWPLADGLEIHECALEMLEQ